MLLVSVVPVHYRLISPGSWWNFLHLLVINMIHYITCVSNMSWRCLYIWSLTKKRANMTLNFDSTFDGRQRRNQRSYWFAMHLIPVKCEVKHVNNFDSSFEARKGVQRHTQLCKPLISYVKGGQRRHRFVELWSVMSRARSNMAISSDSSLNVLITCVFVIFFCFND